MIAKREVEAKTLYVKSQKRERKKQSESGWSGLPCGAASLPHRSRPRRARPPPTSAPPARPWLGVVWWQQPTPGVGNAVAGCGRRWSRPGPGVTFGRGATREPLGRLRWRRCSLHSRRTSQRW